MSYRACASYVSMSHVSPALSCKTFARNPQMIAFFFTLIPTFWTVYLLETLQKFRDVLRSTDYPERQRFWSVRDRRDLVLANVHIILTKTFYFYINRVRGPDGKIFGSKSGRKDPSSWARAKYFFIRPDLSVNKPFIVWPCLLFDLFICERC